jgi:magnesium-transporting ATPase (P-type)
MDGPRQETEKSGGPGLSQPPYCLSYTAVLEQLSTDADDGLTSVEARSRLEIYGQNRLEEGEGLSIGKILLRQIANAMMLVSLGCWRFLFLRKIGFMPFTL